MIVSFFKTPKHQRFNYVPRYYNPEEEERQERLRKSLGETLTRDTSVKRIQFKRQMGYQAAVKKSNLNVIFLIFFISGLFFLIFNALISLPTAILLIALLIVWRTGMLTRFFQFFKPKRRGN
jgi:Flp pilus assembly protein TadB